MPVAGDVVFISENDCGSTTLDEFFLVFMGVLVFLMQAGFAFLEAGSISAKNVTNILFKNLMDALLGAVVWWACGFAFAFGVGTSGQQFVGERYFFLFGLPACELAFWFFQYTFAATATTIVSGAMAGRTNVTGYITYSIITTGFIYPVVVYWVWSDNAWLTDGDGKGNGYTDFAGSGVVHVTGGTAALIGAWLVGPRAGRFDGLQTKNSILGHSAPLMGLGGFILIFGFFAFNGGSQLAIVGNTDGTIVALAMVNTILAASGGGLAAAAIMKFGFNLFCFCCRDTRRSFWSFSAALNGAIGGMVAVCAGAGSVRPWAAFIIGVVAGLAYICWSKALVKLRIDDAIGAVPVHLGGGIWGVIAQPIFEYQTGILYTGSANSFKGLGWNLAGLLAILLWVGVTSFLIFLTLKKLGRLRVSEQAEVSGLDALEHGEQAYNGRQSLATF